MPMVHCYPMLPYFREAKIEKALPQGMKAKRMALPITAVKARMLFLAGAKDSSWPAVYSVE